MDRERLKNNIQTDRASQGARDKILRVDRKIH